MKPVGPIYTLDLFPEMQTRLLHVLSSLTPDEWAGPTVCDGWSVKDVAAHIVADDLSVVSRGRDGHRWWLIDADSLDELIAAINARLFAPLLDTFVRALPYTYRDTDAPDGTHVRLEITGAAGGTWSLVRDGGRWTLCTGDERAPDASVTLPQDAAWRLFTKGMTPASARELAAVEGDAALAERALEMVSILA